MINSILHYFCNAEQKRASDANPRRRFHSVSEVWFLLEMHKLCHTVLPNLQKKYYKSEVLLCQICHTIFFPITAIKVRAWLFADIAVLVQPLVWTQFTATKALYLYNLQSLFLRRSTKKSTVISAQLHPQLEYWERKREGSRLCYLTTHWARWTDAVFV